MGLQVPWNHSGILLQSILDYMGYITTELHRHLKYCHKDCPAWGTVHLSPCFDCALVVVHLDPIQLFLFSPMHSLYVYLVHGHSMIVCFLFTSPFDGTRTIASTSQDLKCSTHMCICICPWLLSFTVRWLVALPQFVGHCAIITCMSMIDLRSTIYHISFIFRLLSRMCFGQVPK